MYGSEQKNADRDNRDARELAAVAKERNCWGCGELLERVTDEPLFHHGHAFCDEGCTLRNGESDEPVDYDEQDRNAAFSERWEMLRDER